jgi:cell division protein FtsB
MTRRQRSTTKAPVRVHPGRLAVLVLGIVAAYFFVSPLRAFFAQQDRYQREVAALAQARAQNAELKAELATMGTQEYVVRQARKDFQLVPPGVQAFVVKGLTPGTVGDGASSASVPKTPPLSVAQRLADLWQTIAN